MPWCIFSRQTDFFKEIQRYLTTMHGNQVIELSFINNYSWKKLLANLTREVVELQEKEYMCENCRNKYLQWNNGSVTKIWLFKVMSKKMGWQVTKSPPLDPPLHFWFHIPYKVLRIFIDIKKYEANHFLYIWANWFVNSMKTLLCFISLLIIVMKHFVESIAQAHKI